MAQIGNEGQTYVIAVFMSLLVFISPSNFFAQCLSNVSFLGLKRQDRLQEWKMDGIASWRVVWETREKASWSSQERDLTTLRLISGGRASIVESLFNIAMISQI